MEFFSSLVQCLTRTDQHKETLATDGKVLNENGQLFAQTISRQLKQHMCLYLTHIHQNDRTV